MGDVGKGKDDDDDNDQGKEVYYHPTEWYPHHTDYNVKEESGEDCASIVLVVRVICGVLGVVILVSVAVFVIYEEKKKIRAVGIGRRGRGRKND